ncbi:MAG: hypothetical protein ABEN55_20330 [Bradymonadaceae bacterium]
MSAAKDQQLQDKHAEYIAQSRERFLPFCVYTFEGGQYRVNWHHRILAGLFELWFDDDFDLLTHLATSTPPRHGKTEQYSVRGPAWIFGKEPSETIIAASRDEDYALENSRAARRIVGYSERYNRVFPEVQIPSKNVVSQSSENWRNTASHWQIVEHGGGYRAFGSGEGISGVGGKYLICEDPYPNRKKAESQSYRDEINNWWEDDFSERTDPMTTPRFLIISTRWHQNDIIGHVTTHAKETEEYPNWVRVNFPGIRVDDGFEIECCGYTEDEERAIRKALQDRIDIPLEDPREIGEPLWPLVGGSDKYEAARNTRPIKFWSLLQGEPMPPGGSIVEEEWLKADSRRWESLPGTKGEWIWTCDPKHGSDDDESSEAVIQLWFNPKRKPGNIYLVDEHKGIWSEPETEDEFLKLAKDSLWARADTKLVEAEGDGRAIVENLHDEIPGLTLCLTSDGPTNFSTQDSKEDRFRAVSRFWRSGNVKLPTKDYAPWITSFISQHVRFGSADRDDRVDASTYAVDYFLREEYDEDEDDPYEGWFD